MMIDSRSELKNLKIEKVKPVSSKRKATSNNAIAQWWESIGLRTKTAIISVAAISLPLIVLGTFTYFYVGQNIANSTKDSKRVRAGGMGNRTIVFMKGRYADIQTVALFPNFTTPKFQAITTFRDQKVLLDNYIKANSFYDSIGLYRLDGTLIVDGGSEPSPENVFKEDYFQEALKTDKPVISQPQLLIVTPKISPTRRIFIPLVAPVKDVTTGKTIAIIRSRMPASALENIYKDYIPVGEQYYLIGANGKFFISLDKDLVGGRLKDWFPNLVTLFENQKADAVRAIDPLNLKPLFAGYAPLPESEGLPNLQWGAMVATDEANALQPLRQFLLILVGVTSVVGILAVLLAIAISRRATKPILEATAAVSELGKGNLDTRLQVQGQDEMAQLGQNINSMAGQLQDFLQLQEAQAKRSQMLAEVSRSSSVEELDAPLSRILEIARENIDCDRLVVYRFVANLKGIIVAEATVRNSTLTSSRTVGLSDPCIPADTIEAYKQGKVLATYDVFNAGFDPAHVELMRKLQIKSNLIVPILRGGEVDGLLIAHACEQQREWQTDEIDQLKDWAKDLGLALGGLATIEQQQAISARETERSETLQRELIGLLSDVEGATQGDLTVRAQITAGEIGIVADFFNAIVESLRDVVSQVKQATAKVNSSVSSNDIAIRGLSDDAKLQAQQLDDALQSVEKMTASIQEVAVNAKQASDASSTAADTAELGSQAIERSAESILQLRQTVAETAKKVKRLGEASQQISKVVVLIDQIALKTNMLAVNASIEAAKAGEEGRGFAVVAEEVGALAAQSTTATKEIERIVANIQRETSEVGEAMEASTEQVVAGTQQVELARKSLGQIVEVSRKVNELFQNISGATVSQVKTSEAVKILMENLATMSQKSSQTSRNVSEALQETVRVANQLQASVETFKVND